MSGPKRKPARAKRSVPPSPTAGDPFFGAFVGRKVVSITAAYLDPSQRGTMMLSIEFADGSRLGVESDRPLKVQWVLRGLPCGQWHTLMPLPREASP